MAFTGPTDDIIVQEGNFAYNFKASGSITAGQVVAIQDTMEVAAFSDKSGGPSGAIGVAAYDVTDSEYVAVYGPGNIVRCIASGTIYRNNRVYPCGAGKVATARYQATTPTLLLNEIGVALENAAAAGTVRVLLV